MIKLITVREAAEMLSLSEATLYNRKGGTESLKRVKLGKSVRFIQQEVEAHIERLCKRR